MIYQHTYQNVLAGWVQAHPQAPETAELLQIMPQLATTKPKTQTRRVEKPCHYGVKLDSFVRDEYIRVVDDENRHVYETQSTYAVQPGRGKKSIARIEITNIRYEDVRNISHEDAVAEGFSDKYAFLETWLKMHDPEMLQDMTNATYLGTVPDHCPQFLAGRPDDRYQSWALTFKVVSIDINAIRAMVEAEAA